jgi:hypothetical protein
VLKVVVYVCDYDKIKSAMGVLFSDCIALGVKQARTQHGLLYGTREVDAVLSNQTEEASA